MTHAVEELLDTFDHLPEAQQREAASAILNRGRLLTLAPMSEETSPEQEPSSSANDLIEVRFIHPRNASFCNVEVSLACTGREAIQGLMIDDGGSSFLTDLPLGQSYSLNLRRTQQVITPNMTFAKAGVINGDLIEVYIDATGAGYNFGEIAKIFIESGVTLSFIRSVTQIIVQLLRNKESRSIRFKYVKEDETKEVEIAGSNSIDDLINAASIMERHQISLQRLSEGTEAQEDEFERQLLAKGLISQIPTRDETDEEFDKFEPIEVAGEPLSETIIRERR
jgi:hypothetical protein